MNRKRRKLGLARETLVRLDPNALTGVGGAAKVTYIPCWIESNFCPTFTCTYFCPTATCTC